MAESGGRYETGQRRGGQPGDRRIGVVWHTQGSGKSLTMAFYAGRVIREPAMANPTIVVLTDRNDLDDQPFGTFSRCTDLLRQPPVQADSRAHLRELLRVDAGGVVFTTIHKFFPEAKGDGHPMLSARRNIVVIADEAHRSQYDFIDGFARHMRDALPNASFIGFTGTPIETTDANTRAVFGDYISVYDIQRAVEDRAQEHILAQEDGKDRLLHAVRELSQAFALAVPHDEALRIRDDVAFMQAVRAGLLKRAPGEAKTQEELDLAVRQIVSRAMASEGVVDIFAAAGLQKPDVSIISDEFLAEVQGMPQRNLAVELLRKLLSSEIHMRRRTNIVQARSFAEMLEQALRRYQNRAVEAAQVIEELIDLARDMRAANARGEALGLSSEELAFYDALGVNDSAVQVLGEPTLKTMARELTESVRRNVSLDWTLRENVRAQMRVHVKRILRKHGYPPDKQEQATQTVLEQAEVLSDAWAAA